MFLMLLALLTAVPVRAQSTAAPPVLHLDLPEALTTLRGASPAVRLTEMYSGNSDAVFWEIGTPVVLIGSAGTCSFSIPVPKLSPGAAVLSGRGKDGIVTTVSIGSFGDMPERSAFDAIERLADKLASSGWQREPNAISPSAASVHRMLLHATDSLVVRSLVCAKTRIVLSLARDPRHPVMSHYELQQDLLP